MYSLQEKHKCDTITYFNIFFNNEHIGVISINEHDSYIFIMEINIFKEYTRMGHAGNVIKFLFKKYNKNIKFCISTVSKSAMPFWHFMLSNYKHKHIRGQIYELIYA